MPPNKERTFPIATVTNWFDDWREGLQKIAPKDYNVTAGLANALTLLSAPPAYPGAPPLLACTQRSMFSCITAAAEIGIQLNGRHAHLIPFRDTKAGTVVCTLMFDWKGLVWLANRSGQLLCPPIAVLVHEQDVFRVTGGHDPRIKHEYCTDGDPGKITHAYIIFQYRTGVQTFEVMTRAEIELVRKCSPNATRPGAPWVVHYAEMCRKTVTHRGCKHQQLSIELQGALLADDAAAMGYAPGERIEPARLTDAQMEQARTGEAETENGNGGQGRTGGGGGGAACGG